MIYPWHGYGRFFTKIAHRGHLRFCLESGHESPGDTRNQLFTVDERDNVGLENGKPDRNF